MLSALTLTPPGGARETGVRALRGSAPARGGTRSALPRCDRVAATAPLASSENTDTTGDRVDPPAPAPRPESQPGQWPRRDSARPRVSACDRRARYTGPR